MKNSTNKQETKFPVREGKEESSVLHDKKPPAKNAYPQPEKQVKNQPEFTDEQPNRKNPDTPK
jgi:hypothetical protein